MKAKATKKKATTKTKALIEGKYSHKFLTRLSPEEGKVLEQIMKDEDIKGYCAAVTKAVMHFKRMQDRIKDLQTKVSELEERNGEIVETVSDYIAVSKRLQSLKI